MPLVMNGTTIPENVASVFSFNGVNITQVFHNGVQVWAQRLVIGVWSGSSAINYKSGLVTSGSNYRLQIGTATTYYGNWLTLSSIGLGVGSSHVDQPAGAWDLRATETTLNLNNGSIGSTTTAPSATNVNFNPVNKLFSGITTNSASWPTRLNTSGGLMRLEAFNASSWNYYPWVTII